ncbi:MAG: SnoaL-like domain [Solirubrobacteraceae bacterium]|nr:SnoaL-like domain [Solirubrobacteraceae bacterium]
MSAENVAIVRRCYEAWNRQDISSLRELAHPDMEVDLSARSLNPDVYRGFERFETLIEEIGEIWEEFSFEPEKVLDAGEQVVGIVRARGLGRGSGVRAQDRIGQVWTIHDGKVARFRLYPEPADALRAAGLS